MNLPAFLEPILGSHALLAFFLFTLLYSFTLPISEEIALVAVGILAHRMNKNFFLAFFASYPGIFGSDVGYYWLARHFGGRLLRSRFFSRMVNPQKVLASELYFQRSGHKITFFCRFLVGIRAPVMIAAGILRMPFKLFAFYDGCAAVLATGLWLSLGYFFSHIWTYRLSSAGKVFAVLGPVAFAVLMTLFYFRLKRIWAPVDAKDASHDDVPQSAEAELPENEKNKKGA